MGPTCCRAHYILEQIRKAGWIHTFYFISCDRAFDPVGISVIHLKIQLMVVRFNCEPIDKPHTVNGIANTCVCLSFKQKAPD